SSWGRSRQWPGSRASRPEPDAKSSSAGQHVDQALEALGPEPAQERLDGLDITHGEVVPTLPVARRRLRRRRGSRLWGNRLRSGGSLGRLLRLAAARFKNRALVVGDVVQRHLDAELVLEKTLDLAGLGALAQLPEGLPDRVHLGETRRLPLGRLR